MVARYSKQFTKQAMVWAERPSPKALTATARSQNVADMANVMQVVWLRTSHSAMCLTDALVSEQLAKSPSNLLIRTTKQRFWSKVLAVV